MNVDQNYHASHNPEQGRKQGWDNSKLNKRMARWSNARLYQRSRESCGDTVCLFAAALCLTPTRKLRNRCMKTDTFDLQRLSDAKVREFGTGERRVSRKEKARTEWSAIDFFRGKPLQDWFPFALSDLVTLPIEYSRQRLVPCLISEILITLSK